MIDYSLESSKQILEDCVNSSNPCIELKLQGAFSYRYEPIKEQHSTCRLAYIQIVNDYTKRPLGLSEGKFPFWFG